jgi:hypothetical protein
MKITRIPGEEEAYQVPAKLINFLVYSILGALVSLGAYMAIWNRADNAWKSSLMIRMENVQEKLGSLQQKIDTGILPRTEERINALADRMRSIENEHDDMSNRESIRR